MSNLYKQIMKNNVKTIYICLDNDAMSDSLKMVENLLKEEIDIYLIRLDQKDPNEVGFENFIRSMNGTKKMSLSLSSLSPSSLCTRSIILAARLPNYHPGLQNYDPALH